MTLRGAGTLLLLASLLTVPSALTSAPTKDCADAPGADALAAMAGHRVVVDAFEDPALTFDLLSPHELGPFTAAEDNHPCVGKIQPGARMTSPAGCTMNWVFRDAAGALYIGTAGHCVSAVGQSVSLSGVGTIGTVAFRMANGPGFDFGLVRIDPALYGLVDPTLCHWGGPAADEIASNGETVHVFGQGFIYGTASATRPRTGVAQGTSSSTVSYVGFAQPGDSGMPIADEDGNAVGIHTHSSFGVAGVRIDPTPKFGTRVSHAMDVAGGAIGTTLSVEPGNVPFSLLGT